MAKTKFEYQSELVWSASAYAFKMNPEYMNTNSGKDKTTNKQIMLMAIDDTDLISDQDREMGAKMRKHFQAYIFKITKGQQLNDFANNAMLFANRDTITSALEIGTIAYLPYLYTKESKQAEIQNRISFAGGGFIGTPGSEISIEIEIVKSVYSAKWDTNYITGFTESDSVVFFPYKKTLLEIGSKVKINGLIKNHSNDNNTTLLNRVKVI